MMADSAGVLSGERVAFTGTLASMTHRQAQALVVEHGGVATAHVAALELVVPLVVLVVLEVSDPAVPAPWLLGVFEVSDPELPLGPLVCASAESENIRWGFNLSVPLRGACLVLCWVGRWRFAWSRVRLAAC